MFPGITRCTGGNDVGNSMGSAFRQRNDVILRQSSFPSPAAIGTTMVKCNLQSSPLKRRKVIDGSIRQFGPSRFSVYPNFISVGIMPYFPNLFRLLRIIFPPYSYDGIRPFTIMLTVHSAIRTISFWIFGIANLRLHTDFFSMLSVIGALLGASRFRIFRTGHAFMCCLSSADFIKMSSSISGLCFPGFGSLVHQESLP